MAVSRPAYSTLKKNIVTILQEVATAEAEANASRAFVVQRDRWRPWIENQQSVALVNVMVDSITPAPGGGTKQYTPDRVTVNIDMYVLGTEQDQVSALGVHTLVPVDEVAADRLDLLIAQVRFGLTRMLRQDFGFAAGQIGRVIGMNLQLYPQEGTQDSGNYAPARWSFTVDLPFYAEDDGPTVDMEEMNVTFQADEPWGLKYTWRPTKAL